MIKNIFTVVIMLSLALLFAACLHRNAYTETIEAGDINKLQEYVEEVGVNTPIFRKDMTFLMLAAQAGDMAMVRYLVEAGADVNQTRAERYGAVSPLRYAISGGNLDIVKYLIEHGANASHKNAAGWTPLMTAAKEGTLEMLVFLVENGADVFAETKEGVLAIDLALQNNNYPIIFYLGNFYGDDFKKELEVEIKQQQSKQKK